MDAGVAPSSSYDYTVSAYDFAGNTSLKSLALNVITLPSGSGVSYTTNFNSIENPISEGGKWVTGKANGLLWNDPKTASGKAYASVRSGTGDSRFDDSVAHLSSAFQTFNADQYAQGTVYLADNYSSATHEVELLLRFTINNYDAHGYEVLWGLSGYIAIVKWNGGLGDYTPLYDPGVGSIRAPRDGDVLRAEIAGNIITITLNGAVVATVDVTAMDWDWPSGQPGIGFWPTDDAIPENYGWKSFQAGDL
jgi:hypothetical protein